MILNIKFEAYRYLSVPDYLISTGRYAAEPPDKHFVDSLPLGTQHGSLDTQIVFFSGQNVFVDTKCVCGYTGCKFWSAT